MLLDALLMLVGELSTPPTTAAPVAATATDENMTVLRMARLGACVTIDGSGT